MKYQFPDENNLSVFDTVEIAVSNGKLKWNNCDCIWCHAWWKYRGWCQWKRHQRRKKDDDDDSDDDDYDDEEEEEEDHDDDNSDK